MFKSYTFNIYLSNIININYKINLIVLINNEIFTKLFFNIENYFLINN